MINECLELILELELCVIKLLIDKYNFLNSVSFGMVLKNIKEELLQL